MDFKNLGDRMKNGYENPYRLYLPINFPVIIRLDGCHFHSFTRGFDKPFDKLFVGVMQSTLLDLCSQIPGCKFGYAQSDEISLLLTNNDTYKTQPWFDNNIQKITSVSASMCSVIFNANFGDNVDFLLKTKQITEYDYAKLQEKVDTAFFDSRVFVLPDYEVNNYFIWRQQDCTRNSILSVAQSLYSAKQIKGINTKALQDKMLQEKDINWNDYPIPLKRGTGCVKKPYMSGEVVRNRWELDLNIPIFSQDVTYINKLIPNFEEK